MPTSKVLNKASAVHKATPPTLLDGDASDILVDSSGRVLTSSNQLDTLHDDFLLLGNYIDTLEGEVISNGNTLDTIHNDLVTLGNYCDTLESPLRIDAPGPAYTTIRSLVTAVADSEPPTDASAWVAMPGASYAGYLEIPVAGAFTAVAGTVAPTQVTMRVWARLGATGTISKVHDETFDASWLVLPVATNPYKPRHIPLNASDAFVTFTFPDGTSPTISGTVQGRMVANAALTAKDFPRDPATGNVIVQSKSYDSATGTEKTTPSVFESDLYLEEPLVVDEASQAVATGTFYYPSADGIVLGPHNCVSFEYSATAAGGGTVAVSFQATNGTSAWTSPKDVSKSGWGCIAGASVAGTVTSEADGTITEIVNFSNKGNSCANFARMRMKLVVATANSGAVAVSVRRSVA